MKHNRFTRWVVEHKKPLLIGFGVLIFLLIILWVFGVFSSETVERNVEETAKAEPPKPVTEASPLTGVQVKPELAKRPVTSIVIENSPDARPQSGLKQAGVVFEAIAEGGITRFVIFYQEAKPGLIGPVRSLRPYFNDWIQTYDAAIAHVGGSAAALAEVRSLGLKDLDQFSNADAYWRSTDRYAPHNVYTNTENLDALSKSKGFTSSEFESIPRKKGNAAETPTARQITIPVSSHLYQVDYTYDKETNTYTRFMGGQPHVDREKGQIKPAVVVAMTAPYSIIEHGRYDYELVGSGKAVIFQDGKVIQGSWERDSRSAQFKFKNSNGQQVKFNAGQTWFTAIGPDRAATWTP